MEICMWRISVAATFSASMARPALSSIRSYRRAAGHLRVAEHSAAPHSFYSTRRLLRYLNPRCSRSPELSSQGSSYGSAGAGSERRVKELMRCSRAARQAAREPAELRDGVVPEGRFRLPVNGDLEFLSRQTKRSESLYYGSSG